MKITLATLLLFTLFCTPATGANLVTFEITANVDAVDDSLGLLGGSILVGDTLTGVLQYDLDLTDSGFFDPNFGTYNATPLVDNFINGTNGTTGNFETTDFLEITVSNNSFGSDQINFSASGDTIPSALAVSGIDFVELDIILQDTDGSVFSDDSLPATLDLADFEEASLDFLAGGLSSSSLAFFVEATITSITPIPEPNTLLLGALAGMGLLARRGRRKS